MIDLGVGEQDAFDWDVSYGGGWHSARWKPSELVADVRRSVEKEPVVPVAADGNRGLSTRPRRLRVASRNPAARTPAIPLWKPTACGGADQEDVHMEERLAGPEASPALED